MIAVIGSLKPLSDRLLSLAKRFGIRVFVHFSSLTLAGLIVYEGSPKYLLAFIYLGLICLFGRFLFKPYGGLVPLCAGLITWVSWVVLGGEAAYGVFLGGIQAWLQSVFAGKKIFRAYSSEKIAAGEIVAVTFLTLGFFFGMGEDIPDSFLFGAIALEAILFPVFLVILWPFALVRGRRKIQTAVNHLEDVTSSGDKVPSRIRDQLRSLIGYVRAFVPLPLIHTARDVFPLARELITVEGCIKHLDHLPDDGEKLRGTERFYTDLKDLNAHLNRNRPTPMEQQTDQAEEKRRPAATFNENEFRLKIASIEAARETAPMLYQAPLAGICRSAENIMEAMRADPGDVAEGSRFLNRYLKSTLDIVEMQKFFAKSPASDSTARQSAETRAVLLLERLETAFASEHALLLENDHLTYVADLNALDRLLDMEAGAKK